MIKNALRILIRPIRRKLEDIQFHAYCRKMENEGVCIDPRARIVGVAGIRIGKGTVVSRDATLIITDVGISDRFHYQSKGIITIGERCRILPGAIVAASEGRIELGNNVSVNPYTILYGYGGLRIGDNTRIAAHTVIVASNHRFSDPDNPIDTQGIVGEGVDIGDDVWIGTGVRILDGVKIGRGAVIGAGAVVTKDIAPYNIAAGVPARKIGSRLDGTPRTRADFQK